MVIDKRDILATSVRNVEELKRRYDLDKEAENAEPVDLSEYVKNDVFPISIANGGTGATDRINAYRALAFIGNNPVTSTANDTTAIWKTKGNGWAWYNKTGQLTDQPSQYGFLINYVNGGDVGQEFISQSSGRRYYRSGNASGWATTWRETLTNANGMLKPTLLWTNATSGAMAAQTVTIGDDVDNYSFVFVVYGPYNRGTQMTTGLHPVIKNTEFEVRLYASGLSYFGYRNLKFKDTTMTVGVGQEASSYTGSFSTFNSMSVPYYVYGVK